MAGFDDNWQNTSVGYGERTYMTDLINFVNKQDLKKFQSFRFFGNVVVYKQLWLPVYKDGKPIAGKNGRNMQIPKLVTNYDIKKQNYNEEKPCPYALLAEKMNEYLPKEQQAYESAVVVAQCIDRDAQENLPAKIKPPTKEETKTGFRDIDSPHKNPVFGMTFTANEFGKIKGTMELNTVKLKSGEKVTKSLADPKYGYDINLKYDKDAKVASDKLKIQKGDRAALTEEELEYLPWNLEAAVASQVDLYKDAKKEADRLWAEFEKSLKKSGKSKSKSDDDDDNDDESPTDLEDDEEDEKPKKKKIAKKTKDEDDDDDEEEKPKKKLKNKKKDDEEDDEDDEDNEEEEDDEEEKPKKKLKKKKQDDEEDDEKPKKKKRKDDDEKPKKKKSKKKKDDDDDEEEDDDDDDLDNLNLDSDDD